MGRDYTDALYVEVEGALLWHVCELTYLDTFIMNGFTPTNSRRKNKSNHKTISHRFEIQQIPVESQTRQDLGTTVGRGCKTEHLLKGFSVSQFAVSYCVVK